MSVIQSFRPNFLTLSPLVVALAYFAARYEQPYKVEAFELYWVVWVVLAAILAHAAVNLLNEYQDYQSGLDLKTNRTPFSGGSGALPEQPDLLTQVWLAFIVVTALLVISGGVFIWKFGWPILFVGITGLFLIISYTKWITLHPWWCLIAAGLAFGPLMVLGSSYIFSGQMSMLSIVLSVMVFFLVNHLLLLNQIPDLDADASVGRFNVVMLVGVKRALWIFVGFMWLPLLVWQFYLYVEPGSNGWLYLPYLSLFIVLPMTWLALKSQRTDLQWMRLLGFNVVLNHLLPLLLMIAFVVI